MPVPVRHDMSMRCEGSDALKTPTLPSHNAALHRERQNETSVGAGLSVIQGRPGRRYS